MRCRWEKHPLAALACMLAIAALVASGCGMVGPEPTPTPTPPTPSATPSPVPSPTPAPPTATPTATPEPEATREAIVVASASGSGPFAIASLSAISLQGGRKYVLQVTSSTGRVEFFGSYSASAMGAGGQPGVQVELLDGVTPVTYPILPPAANPSDWLYGVSVQSRGDGGIRLTILDVTGVESAEEGT